MTNLIAGRYKKLKTIGSGGQGVVYLCHDPELERNVAIKVHHLLEHETKERHRFIDEAKRTAQLDHRNIVTIYDLDFNGDSPCIVMEYLPYTLKQILDEQIYLSPTKSVGIAKELCVALEYAHKQKIVHRDIKPQNIMFSANNHLRLCDFGVSAIPLEQTVPNAGSYPYAPYEQWSGVFDYTSDIYALGIVMFELLTGNLPYHGLNPLDYIELHKSADIPSIPSKFKIPNKLEAIVKKCIAKSQDERYQTVKELLDELTKLSDTYLDNGKPEFPADSIFYDKAEDYLDSYEYQKAIVQYTKAIAANSEMAKAIYGRGNAHYNLNHFKEAVEDFSRVIDIEPKNKDAYYWRSLAHKYLKQTTKAISDIDMALSIDPDDTFFIDAKNELDTK